MMPKRVRMQKDKKEDRISNLSDHLKHQILSYIPTRNAATTTILSHSWKDFWLTLPCFRLDEDFFSSIKKNHPDISLEQLLIIVDQIFTMRSLYIDSHTTNNNIVTELKLHVPLLDVRGNGSSNSKGIPGSIVWLLNKFIICAVNEFQAKKLDIAYGFQVDYTKGQQYRTDATILPLLPTTMAYWKKEVEITSLKLNGFALNSCIVTKWSTLKSLTFLNVNLLDQSLLDSLIANLPLIEYLNMQCCTGKFDTLKASCLQRLVTLCIISKGNFKKIEINAPKLEVFSFVNVLRDDCVIHDLTVSKNLKALQIYYNTIIDDEWLNRIDVNSLSKLKKLALLGCPKLRRVEISSMSLNTIKLQIERLEELKILDASKLITLELHTYFRSSSFILNNVSPLTTVQVWFWNDDRRGIVTNELKYANIAKVLGCLNDVRRLELHNLEKCLVPLKVRKTLKPPLDAAKGQKLEYIIHQWKENDSFRDLIDGLLWLSLRPETVTIKLPQGAPRKLEFDYKAVDDNTLGKCDYCKSLPTRCWRHCLDKVTIINEGVVNSPASSKIDAELLEFFRTATKSQNAILVYKL